MNISLSLGCNYIRCRFSIRMCVRLGTAGLYCITKGHVSLPTLVFSLGAFFSVREFDFRECFIYKFVWVASRSKAWFEYSYFFYGSLL